MGMIQIADQKVLEHFSEIKEEYSDLARFIGDKILIIDLTTDRITEAKQKMRECKDKFHKTLNEVADKMKLTEGEWSFDDTKNIFYIKDKKEK